MKVKELVAKLSSLNQDADVICCLEDDPLSAEFKPLEIEDIDSGDAEKRRSEQGVPGLKFEKTPLSKPHVYIHVTSDF